MLVASQLFTTLAFADESGTYKLDGEGYYAYHHDFSKRDGQTNSFDLSRVYFGIKYNISDQFTARYLTDIGHEPGGGKLEVFAKYAYLDWGISSNGMLIFSWACKVPTTGTHWRKPGVIAQYANRRWNRSESTGLT